MPEPRRSADILVDHLLSTPGLLDQVKLKPEDTLREVAKQVTRDLPPPAFVSDRWTYRIVVLALGGVCIAATFGAIYLSAIASTGSSPNIPDVLTALGAAAIGALAGLLAPSPTSK
ncbi:MAG: hypothetical protein NTX17_09925 [Candidatus Eisenbacteria bacterium]|nr:hypothetical protein [Candidatus Eisenbacteria bacterium]